MCGSPFHPASGSCDSDGKLTCGACVRSLITCYKDVGNPRRTCSGVPFYIHAFPPRELTPVEKLFMMTPEELGQAALKGASK